MDGLAPRSSGQARIRRALGALISLVIGTLAGLAFAAEPIPSPLSLSQALAMAAAHPRLAEPDDSLPRAAPLFIACHDLAFNGAVTADDSRNLAWSSPLMTAEDAQRLEIMQRFFDVLIADLSFARDNESMAVAFVQLDRARARAELGQFSPLRVAELESAYQLIRRQRAASETAQRLTRLLLGQALGQVDAMPDRLTQPPTLPKDQMVTEPDTVIREAHADNQRIQALIAERQTPSGKMLLEMNIQQRAFELLARLALLDQVAEQVAAEADWRDLKLDESRTLYELEAQADLGFSMSQQTRARRDQEQVELCRALTWAELNALRGKVVQ